MIFHSDQKGDDCIRKLQCHCIKILHSDIYSVLSNLYIVQAVHLCQWDLSICMEEFMISPLGPSLYYVIIFWTFSDPPTHYGSINTVLNISKNCHFLHPPRHPPTQSFCIHNIGMVHLQSVCECVFECKLDKLVSFGAEMCCRSLRYLLLICITD